MRRWLAMLLLVLLPLQFSWAAAAPYCGHETGPASQHFGHHDHQHHTADADHGMGASQDAPASDSSLPGGDHADCGFCHLNCAKTIASDVRLPRSPLSEPQARFAPRSYVSDLRGRIERPNWQHAA